MTANRTRRLRRPRLKAPFPWFGGKSRVAHIVWQRFGDCPNYVEPFFGSGAVLLGRPAEWPLRNETVNDLDCYLANFWRALQADPDAVAAAADWPVNEADLHARHQWLHALKAHGGLEPFRERMHSEADFHDAEVAGIWVWGISCWIGDAWCRTTEQRAMPNLYRFGGSNAKDFRGDGMGLDARRPNLQGGGNGVHASGIRPCDDKKRPRLGNGERGTNRKRPHVGGKGGVGVHAKRAGGGQLPILNNTGEGVHRPSLKAAGDGLSRQMPDVSGDGGASGRGVNAKYVQGDGLSQKMPRCDRNYGIPFNAGLLDYMRRLAERLRYVRVCCGEWDRILGPAPTWKIGTTAVFLDPPYGDADRDTVYSCDSLAVAGKVREWCLEHGDNDKLRIALCGYAGLDGSAGEHDELAEAGWSVVAWKAAGGYGARNKANLNAARERIWFSPHCLDPEAERQPLFAGLEAGKESACNP